jgi:endonuclease-3 related protein
LNRKRLLRKIYHCLYTAFGPQKWWPASTPFEVMVGAILTQNTAWKNVELAIRNLRKAHCLNPKHLYKLNQRDLALLIKPAGYYNVKAQRLKNFLEYFWQNYRLNVSRMLKVRTQDLRRELLAVKGIGPETADSILLYAARRPVFVVDAYTRRIFYRHAIAQRNSSYEDLQKLFMQNLPRRAALFNEYHALLVFLGKHYCRKRPSCQECPLGKITANTKINLH